MNKIKKGFLTLGLSLLLGGAALGVNQVNVLHEVDAAATGTWGICGWLNSSTWRDDVYSVADDGTTSVTVPLQAGDVFKWRANGAWTNDIRYDELVGASTEITIEGFQTTIGDHFISAGGTDGNIAVAEGKGGNYTFTFADGSAAVTENPQNGMKIKYEAFSTSYTVTVNKVINGVAQDSKTQTFTVAGKTLADLETSMYGYEVASYAVDGATVEATKVIDSDMTVTVNYKDSGTLNSYEFDYSAASEAFGANVYIYYWRTDSTGANVEEVAWPGIKLSATDGVTTVRIPSTAVYMILNNNSGVQTVDIPMDEATTKYVLDGEIDTAKHYTGAWATATGPVVTIKRMINGVEQDGLTETVTSGTTLAGLTTSLDVYGWTIASYYVGETEVQSTYAFTADTELTVNYTAVTGSKTYTVDFRSYSSTIGEYFYAHIWKAESTEGAGDGDDSDLKLPATNSIATVVVPADATAFLIWNSPSETYLSWQTIDITPSGVDNDCYRITGFDATYTSNYAGAWDSSVSTFVTLFFQKTSVCSATGDTNTETLVTNWADLVTAWGNLTDTEKTTIKNTAADYSESAVGTVAGVVARYDLIVAKYGGIQGITDFMDRQPPTLKVYTEGMTAEQRGQLTATLCFLGLGVVGVAVGIFFISRRKEQKR